MTWRSASGAALLAFAAVVLAGCQTMPAGSTSKPLQLTSLAPLQLDETCKAPGSVIIDFTVLPDGGTTGIRTPAVPQCLHDALTAWVASFRYAPPGEAVPTSVEWLLVTAKRGS